MRIMRALTACAALAAILGPVRAESAPRGLEHIQWDDADVRIWDWKRAPVFLAGWTGPVLPYTLRSDRVVPILGEEALVPMKGMDVVDVLPLSDNEILFEARFRPGPGGPSRGAGLYYHRTGSAEPKPVAGTEAIGLHTGCVYPKSRQVAFARGGTEVIARLGPAGQLVGLQEAGSPLSQCLWLGHDELIGIATSGGRLTRCRSTAGQIACAGTSALEGLDSASKLFLTRQGKAGVLGRRSNEPNSGIFLFSKDFESVSGPMADRDSPGGASILDYDGEIRRYGFHAKYFINLARDAAGVVYSAARIGSKVFGIVSTPARPKSLARLERGAWKLFQSEKEAAKPDGPPLREVWIQLRSGYLVQAFHFGRPDSDKAVIWWHGGNQVGNSSPRYSPYFHFLAENGYSTLAVNYPGDLGRGPGHSGKFTEPFLTDTADASVRYLREAGATRIVSWSLSGGLRLQQSVLGAQEKVSGIIDQVGRLVDRDEKGKRVGRGYGTRRHRELAAQRGIPYFTIRGRFDNPDEEPADYLYEGGHSLQFFSEFLRLAGPVLEFMEATPRIGDVSSAPARVAIAQPAATPAARFLIPDPLFELGHHVFRTCGERLSLQMSPIGTPSRSAEVTLGPRLTLAPAPQAAKTARKPTVSPALASGLKAAGLEKPLLETDETSCRITLSVAPASRSRKGSPETILSEDGVLYRKGLVSAAQPLCAALEARDACQR